jgi:hypothetical protein
MHDLVCQSSQCAALAYNGSSRRVINFEVKPTWPNMDITQLWKQLGQGSLRDADSALQRREVTSRTVPKVVLTWCPWLPLNKTTLIHNDYFCLFFANSPQWATASWFTSFLDHTQRRTTVVMTPLDEWSAPRRDLYLKTHNTHNRRTSMPSVGFEPAIPANERPQIHAIDRAATGTGTMTTETLEMQAASTTEVSVVVKIDTALYSKRPYVCTHTHMYIRGSSRK